MRYFFLLFTVVASITFAKGQKTWEFTEFKNQFITSADTVYVVNFWATWCSPCVRELPVFEENITHFANKPVKFYFLSLDFGDNAFEKANNYLAKKNYSFRSLLTTDDNANEWIPLVDESWSGSIPATVFYKGSQKMFHAGMFTAEDLEKQITKMLTKQ